MLDRVGLGSASARRVATYSKGMRQRLGLAQALIGEPQVLLLDEPTTGLDPALRLSFYEIVQALRDRGATVVLSSHALAELGERADRVVIMNRGAMVAHGSIDELRRIARLPAKIRLTISGSPKTIQNWLGTGEKWRQVNGHVVEIEAPPERKIELLRRATDVGAPVKDVDVMQPTLDELYAHFLRTQGGGTMRNVLLIAAKEIQESLRNWWVLSTTLLLAALALTLTFLGSAPTGSVGVRALDVVIVSLSSLTIFLLPLIALLISHDAIVGEIERGTMLLAVELSRGPLAGPAR